MKIETDRGVPDCRFTVRRVGNLDGFESHHFRPAVLVNSYCLCVHRASITDSQRQIKPQCTRIRPVENIVIIGAGHGAGQVVLSLRQKKFAGRIALIGDESWLPYQRPPLSKKFLAGDLPAERLFCKPESFYDDPSISVALNTRVTGINREEKKVTTEDGSCFDYDGLVIATGSRPRPLEVPGVELEGIHYLRGIDDVDAIRNDMESGGRIAIVGAGYIGLETAAGREAARDGRYRRRGGGAAS